MAINTVNIGAAPNDGTGDTLRASFTVLNNNFTDAANAAEKLVQVSPSDTVASRVVLTNSFDSAGGIVLTTGGTNLTVFGGVGLDDAVSFGSALSATTAIFALPISSFTLPVSITVTDTFDVRDMTGGAVAGGNAVTPIIDIQSSNKLCIITVGGLTTTTDKPLMLRTGNVTSKIEVNF